MRLLSILVLAGLAAAEASIYERQVETINMVLQYINRDTTSLNQAVQSFNSPADTQALIQAHTRLTQTVTTGAQQVSQAGSISLTDATQLQSSVGTLTKTIESTVGNLSQKKSLIIQSGAGTAVTQGLQQQLAGANQLSAGIVAKVPMSVQPLAQQLSVGISAALQKGVDSFADQAAGGQGFATNRGGGFATSTMSGNPAFFTGAAMPKAVAGRLAGVAGVVALVL